MMARRKKKEEDNQHIALIKNGMNSDILRSLAGCDKCPIRSYCSKKQSLNEKERKSGCRSLRELYLTFLKAYGKPETMLLKRCSSLGFKLMLQEIKDNSNEKVISREQIELMKLEKEFLEMIFKYGKGTHSIQEIIIRKEENIIVNPNAYGIHADIEGSKERDRKNLPTNE